MLHLTAIQFLQDYPRVWSNP